MAVRTIVDLLVRGEFGAIEAITRGSRMSAEDLETAVRSYGRHVVRPPEQAWQFLDVVPIEGSYPSQYHVAFSLWTKEEGESDLTIELRLTELADSLYEPEVLNLHTL